MMKRLFVFLNLAGTAGTVLAGGCSSPDTSGRVDAVGPDVAQFQAVAPMLVRRCGSIDCHGSLYRNFRLYGFGGTRLAPTDRPDFPTLPSAAEIAADYDAVVGVEPEIMAEVVRSGGAGTERLTLVRKARFEENHKGGQRIVRGDDADVCLLTWLSSSTDQAACRRAACGVGETNQLCMP
ncbi:MAG: hypothetical protein JWP97_2303 [Labilithrix sp.]|nr:hypothetical protein [Labilithrix sp.]